MASPTSIPTWPALLPRFDIGYRAEVVDACLRAETEDGYQEVIPLQPEEGLRQSVSWTMSRDQFALFQAWWRHPKGLAGGALEFEVQLDLGAGYLPQRVAFAGAYSWSRRGRMYVVSAEILAPEFQTLAADELEALLNPELVDGPADLRQAAAEMDNLLGDFAAMFGGQS